LLKNTLKYGSMKRLDQGHLHPKLEVPRLTCLGKESNVGLRGRGGEHSSKTLFEQCINSYSEHIHMSPRQYLTTLLVCSQAMVEAGVSWESWSFPPVSRRQCPTWQSTAATPWPTAPPPSRLPHTSPPFSAAPSMLSGERCY